MSLITLRTPEIKSLIIKMYEKLPKPISSILLLGRAGIGKSEIVYQLAESLANKLNKKLVMYDDLTANEILQNPDQYFVVLDLRLSECEPSDFIGIPYRRDSYVEYAPLKYAYVFRKVSGIIFLDEITNITRDDVKSACYKLLLDRMFGFTKINDNVLIIGAGNTSDISSIAQPLPAPLINRCIVILTNPPTIEEWNEYMNAKYSDQWCKRTFAYLMLNQNDFIKDPDAPETFNQYPTPRTWTKLALVLTPKPFEIYTEKEIKSLCCGLLGEEVGLKFFKFLKYQVPSIQDILDKPELYRRLDIDVKAIFVVEFAEYVKRNKDKIFKIKGVNVECEPRVKKLIETILSDSEELTLLFIQSLGTAKYEITAKMLLAIPSVKEFLRKLKELREQIEKNLGRSIE